MSKRRNGLFDPDYRTKGWRDSAFTPRKNSTSITQIASIITALIAFALESNQDLWRSATSSTINMGISLAILGAIWLTLGITIRYLVWRSIRHKTQNFQEFRIPDDISSNTRPEKIYTVVNRRDTTARKTRKRILLELYVLTGILLGIALFIFEPTRAFFVQNNWLETSLSLSFFIVVALIALRIAQRVMNLKDEVDDKNKDDITQETPQTAVAQSSPMSPRTFEHEVAWLFNTLTKHKAIVVGGAGDGGVDIKIYNRLDELIAIVQCKRYQPDKALAPLFVREVFAVKQKYGVKTAYLATTATFTNETRKEAANMQIKLIDGNELAKMQVRARAISRAKIS